MIASYYSRAHITLYEQVKDRPKVPIRQLKWSSNLRPCGRKAPNLPLRHHTPKLEASVLHSGWMMWSREEPDHPTQQSKDIYGQELMRGRHTIPLRYKMEHI